MAVAIPEPFAWDPSFDIKVELFNEQHKGLFDGIAKLEKEPTMANLGTLAELVKVHFQAEEECFDANSYADAASHKATHAGFLQKVGDIKEVTPDVVDFAKKWLVTHIKVTDVKYAGLLPA
eukprot:CAMPEP_0201487668 /NCGR_PEP_ID=MMETSP0151_2-20130828/14817_1 /ASSEMBLY_ACC=CAM_ASM_000257 /TAXON_ID=200890 /ORGANISM="Paramoeba atlantica, Strain 621/1 / CCAP 1560/9" /LENGTH=120 /DNA_ID=CAMNT_0047872783 /DNA_START=56 /DNA_END=418 /DNA_ORIENTATION=+